LAGANQFYSMKQMLHIQLLSDCSAACSEATAQLSILGTSGSC